MIVIGFFLPIISFGQLPITEAPKTIDEVKEIGHKAIDAAERELPGIFRQIWQNEVLPIWQGMWEWAEPKIQTIWQRIQNLFLGEIEKRRPIIEEEFEKEKDEIKKELPEVRRSLWERFQKLIR